MNARIKYFDIAKGILILLLLFHHYGSATSRLPGEYPDIFLLRSGQFVFTCFFMQCFFFLSGYCTSMDKPWKDFLYAQFRQLLVPIFTFGFLCNLFTMVEHTGFLSFSLPVLYGAGLWFLWALLIAKIILFVLGKLCRGNLRIILPVSFVLMLLGFALKNYDIGNNVCFIRHGLGSCFIIALGAYAKKHQALFEKAKDLSSVLFPWTLLLMVITHTDVPVFTAGMDVAMRQIPAFLIISTLGALAFLKYTQMLEPYLMPFAFYGKGSIVVYGLHFPFLMLLVFHFNSLLSPESTFEKAVYFFGVYSCEIAVCTLLILLFHLKGLSWLMGRSNLAQKQKLAQNPATR